MHGEHSGWPTYTCPCSAAPGKGGGPLLVPYYFAENVIELATALRGAARYRTPVL